MKRYINLDMDGVVADFDQFVSELLKRRVSWNDKDLSDEEWSVLATVDNIYAKLPLIEKSVDLVQIAKTAARELDMGIRFLTAIPRRKTMPTAQADKIEWAGRYFPDVPVEAGPYSKDKQNWCNTLDILVDDKLLNVEQWVAKGGIAVFHQGNWNWTLGAFQRAIKMDYPGVLFFTAGVKKYYFLQQG